MGCDWAPPTCKTGKVVDKEVYKELLVVLEAYVLHHKGCHGDWWQTQTADLSMLYVNEVATYKDWPAIVPEKIDAFAMDITSSEEEGA